MTQNQKSKASNRHSSEMIQMLVLADTNFKVDIISLSMSLKKKYGHN